STTVIGVDLLPESLQGDRPRPLPAPLQADSGVSFYETMERLEREIILETLKSVNGVQRRAAARLGLNPTTLNEKIKRLKIPVRQAPTPSILPMLDKPHTATLIIFLTGWSLTVVLG